VERAAARDPEVKIFAGEIATAAPLAGQAGNGKVVCVVSGGNIDAEVLAAILNGDLP